MARDLLKAWIFGLVFTAVILGTEFVVQVAQAARTSTACSFTMKEEYDFSRGERQALQARNEPSAAGRFYESHDHRHSRAARNEDHLQGLAAGGRPADAPQQSRSGGRGEAG